MQSRVAFAEAFITSTPRLGSTRTTETGGREMGVLEQLFGNLLNLDAEQFQDQ